METSVQIVEISILRYFPELVAWGIGIVLAVLMVRRGGGKAEKLLLAGCSLIFVTRLGTPLLHELVQWLLAGQGMSNIEIIQTTGWAISLPMTIVGIAGLVCLVWAFWARFRGEKQVPT